MKKLNNSILIIWLILISSNNILGQSGQEKRQIIFKGVFEGNKKNDSYDKIGINYWPDKGYTHSGINYITAKIDSNDNFVFKLPDLNTPYKINLVVYNSDLSKVLWNNKYYVESNDSINMHIMLRKHRDSVVFSGSGMEKYNLVQKLYKQFETEYWPELSLIKRGIIKDSIDLHSRINKLVSLIRKFEAKKKSLISASNISAEMRAILNYECEYYYEWQWRLELLYLGNESYRKHIVNYYNRYNEEFTTPINKFSEKCPQYILRLSSRIMLELMMKSYSDKVDVKSFYNYVKYNYSGVVRDHLIGNFVFSKNPHINIPPSNAFLRDSLNNDAAKLVSTSYVKKSIINRISDLEKVNKGAKVFESEFIGVDGKKFSLKSLKGKVFLIDAWFFGCKGCALFHKVYEKEIYPTFKDDKNFVLLSVNFDKNKENWEKGMASNLYTSKSNINVNTGKGTGLDHPFMKYYNVKGGPYLMLVDSNGDILYQPQNTSVQEIIDIISKALRRNSLP